MFKSVFPGILILLVTITPSSSEILQVPSDYVTIQYAINQANDGDVIIVEPGVYLENINFLGKNITVTGTAPENPAIVATTIIDGYRSGSTVTFNSGESKEAVLSGFTITGGYGTKDNVIGGENYIYWGAGIYCSYSSPTIRNNIIAGNTGAQQMEGNDPSTWRLGYGGGILCFESDASIYCNTIKNNKAFAGAGIMSYFSDAIIYNNLIYENSANVGGGVVLLGGNLINNTITANDVNAINGNELGIAGNIYAGTDAEIGQYLIANNIICNAKSGGGLITAGTGRGPIICNNVWNNSPWNYREEDMQTGELIQSRGTDLTGRSGNISEDPLFVDPTSKDYHLLPDSPCIGAGNKDYIWEPNQTDIDSDPRIYADNVDIGADEYTGYIKPIAYAGPNQYVSTLGLVTLDGSGSYFYDPYGIKLFYWKQVFGPEVILSDPNSMNPTFMPEPDSECRFELIVSDAINESLPDEVSIVVQNLTPAIADPNQ
jgi:hypothetical protein